MTDELDDIITQLQLGFDPATKEQFRDLDKWSLKRSLRKCGLKQLPDATADFDRADGRMICEICKQEYRDHPRDWRIIGYDNMPFLNILSLSETINKKTRHNFRRDGPFEQGGNTCILFPVWKIR